MKEIHLKIPKLHIPEPTSLTSKRYSDMTLPELLETRDKIISFEKDIKRLDNGNELYKFAMSHLQHYIYYRRTHRSSGLVIPYNKDITND